MFHDTAEKCCEFFFDDKNCPTIDVCNGAPPPPPPPKDAPSPSSSGGGGGGKCRWHVDIKMQDGCTDSNEVREREECFFKHSFYAQFCSILCTLLISIYSMQTTTKNKYNSIHQNGHDHRQAK